MPHGRVGREAPQFIDVARREGAKVGDGHIGMTECRPRSLKVSHRPAPAGGRRVDQDGAQAAGSRCEHAEDDGPQKATWRPFLICSTVRRATAGALSSMKRTAESAAYSRLSSNESQRRP